MKLHPMYGNAGHVFPRTVEEAFGPGACVFVSTEDDDQQDIVGAIRFSMLFGFVVYTLAAIVVGVILWGTK